MTVRTETVRGVATLVLSVAGAAALWSVRVPAPRWTEVWSTRGAPTEVIDAVGFALWCTATAAVSYLAVAAALQLIVVACERRAGAPRLRHVTDRLTPRWMALATVGVMTGSACVAPHAGAATVANGPGDPRPDVVMDVVTDEDDGDRDAPRTMLPWASQLQRSASSVAPPTTSTDPPSTSTSTSSTTAAPTTGHTGQTNRSGPTDPATRSVPVPSTGAPSPDAGVREAPRLEALDELTSAGAESPGLDQLPPPLVIEVSPSSPTGAAGAHVVSAGESFWTIAEQVVAERALPVPVASYWRLLVEANRDRLVDRADPDLIHPGQELVLP